MSLHDSISTISMVSYVITGHFFLSEKGDTTSISVHLGVFGFILLRTNQMSQYLGHN
jgi:hypothetical protein